MKFRPYSLIWSYALFHRAILLLHCDTKIQVCSPLSNSISAVPRANTMSCSASYRTWSVDGFQRSRVLQCKECLSGLVYLVKGADLDIWVHDESLELIHPLFLHRLKPSRKGAEDMSDLRNCSLDVPSWSPALSRKEGYSVAYSHGVKKW